MDLLEAGKIINTHGLRGEVKVAPWTDYPDDFENIDYVFVKKKTGEERLDIKNIKYQKNNLIIKFSQINDINEAENYKNLILYVEREMLGELEEGVYYIADLIGLEVFSESGEKIGVINDVINHGASDIYEIKRENNRDLLLPVIDEFVKSVDIEAKRVVVNVPEGLDEL